MKNYKYTVFTSEIETGIKKGILKAGDKLPSVRGIKAKYELSTSSVQKGYEDLMLKGLVTSIPRSGYTVALTAKTPAVERARDSREVVSDPLFDLHLRLTSSQRRQPGNVTLNSAAPSDFFIPQKLILKTMQQVIREKGASLLRYYPSDGSAELKSLLSTRSAIFGNTVRPGELLITDGALQALYIALSVTTMRNDTIAVESPCVFSVLEVISNLGLKAIEIPVNDTEGFDTDQLRKVCKNIPVKAIVLTPNFHNPTGMLMTDERKRDVYEIAAFNHITVIENDVYGDLHFNRSRPSNIKKYDAEGLVMTFSSFSKTAAPGIRLGWLAAGPFFPKAERLKFSLGRSVSPFNQEVVVKLLQSPAYDRHLQVFRLQLKQQHDELIKQLKTCFSENICVHVPEGGYSIWNRLPQNTDMELFYRNSKKLGISFTPGYTFSQRDSYHHYFRTVISHNFSPAYFKLMKKLGESVKG